MKNYWKYLIMFLFTGYACFHAGMVFWVGGRDYQLTSKDYYDRETQYQATLDQINAGSQYTWTQSVDHKTGRMSLAVRDAAGNTVVLQDVTVELYRPNNADNDISLALTPSNEGFIGETSPFEGGRWNLSVSAKQGDRPIRWEQKLSL